MFRCLVLCPALCSAASLSVLAAGGTPPHADQLAEAMREFESNQRDGSRLASCMRDAYGHLDAAGVACSKLDAAAKSW